MRLDNEQESKKAVLEMQRWAAEHPWEWEIVCGVRNTGDYTCRKIIDMLRDDNQPILCSMLWCRLYQFDYDANPEMHGPDEPPKPPSRVFPLPYLNDTP